MMKIKNIIFDLGNVLYVIDEKRFVTCFQNLGLNTVQSFYNQDIIKFHHLYETGDISTNEFYEKICEVFNKKISFEDFKKCWNSLLVGFVNENIEYLNKLSTYYRIFILSNINDLHFQAITSDFRLGKIKAEKFYFSHIEGYRKPDKKFFEKIIYENQLSPFQTLFLDDSPENITVAKNLGLKTIWIPNPFLLIKYLKKFLKENHLITGKIIL